MAAPKVLQKLSCVNGLKPSKIFSELETTTFLLDVRQFLKVKSLIYDDCVFVVCEDSVAKPVKEP